MTGHTETTRDEAAGSPLLHQIVDPWYEALAAPREAQDAALRSLTQGYSMTRYGMEHGAGSVDGVEGYRASFPVSNYETLLPYIAMVKAGDHSALLAEPVRRWVMTRGTTGHSKVIPTGETHLSQILMMGARCVVNFALKKDYDVLETAVLNLNFPSEVHMMEAPGGSEPYGYSSGTYAKLNPELMGARLVPSQEEVDSLGGGIARRDWEDRYELAYERARGTDIGSLIGVTPVMVGFARYMRRKHGAWPRDLWKPRALFCTSVAKIHTKYGPTLRHHYGPSPVVEMYTATEGVFAQQLGDLPYVSPNYDAYFFEVVTRNGTKMLHELKPNEWGSLVISTPMLPRYEIGDLVESLGKGYFRVFGRDRFLSRVEHRMFNLMAFRF